MAQRPDSPPTLVWLNGHLVDASHPAISPSDPGFLLGLGVFETLALRHARPLAISRHHSRLASSASTLGLHAPSLESIRSAVAETSAANGLTDARIRITLTGDPASPLPQSTLVSATPLVLPIQPATAVFCPFQRNPSSPLSGIKSTSYAESILALRFAISRGADEAILCDTAGNLSEASSSNLFFVRSGLLHSPPLSTACLPGITRSLVLQICETHGLPCDLSPTNPQALLDSDEAFLTSSIRGVHPLSSIDGRSFPSAPGPVTAQIIRLLSDLFQSSPDP